MYFIAAVIFLYLLFLTILIFFWHKPAEKKGAASRAVFISVIIPVRNEPHLHLLLDDLKNQTLDGKQYEVIIIDDHSKDRIISSGRGEKLLHQKEGVHGKKAALTYGIDQAQGNVITTIDADCRIGINFLKEIHDLFSNRDLVLSPGLIRYGPVKNLFEKIQAMETAAVMGTGVASHRMGITSLSNGANLAFTKEVWLETGGYKKHQHIASGDDEFFVQEVAMKYPDKVVFRTGRQSLVTTAPHQTFTDFIHQRLRWAGKWRKYEDMRMKIMAAAVFLFHLMICAGLILLFSAFHEVLISLFLLKFLLEGYLIFKVSKRLGSYFSLFPLMILQFLYSPYVVIFGLAANFVPYKWKDRHYNH